MFLIAGLSGLGTVIPQNKVSIDISYVDNMVYQAPSNAEPYKLPRG
jgi:hypothetical protein